MRDLVLKLNTKPIQRSLAVPPNRHVPFLANISQCQVEQFAQHLIAWKRSTVLCNLAQAHVHRLNDIGRVIHFANLRWIVKERNDALPVAWEVHTRTRSPSSQGCSASDSQGRLSASPTEISARNWRKRHHKAVLKVNRRYAMPAGTT